MTPRIEMFDNKKIRCLLMHDHVLLREGLRRLLEDEPDLKIVAEASNADESLPLLLKYRPDVVIAGAAGLDSSAMRMAFEASPQTQVIWLNTQSSLASAAAGNCVLLQSTAQELVDMVRRIHGVRGLPAESSERAEWLSPTSAPRKPSLTAREREVLRLLAQGRTVRSAASALGLSVKTVDAHKFNLMRKLGVHNKAELVMRAIQQRVVKFPVNF
jgi:two-component system response regulator NreC